MIRCRVPGLEKLNITEEELRNVSIPREVKDGKSVWSSCLMYDVNYTGWTEDDVRGHTGYQRSQLNTTKCHAGWIYDSSIYKSSVVTEVKLISYTIILNELIETINKNITSCIP